MLQRITINPPDYVVPVFVETWSGQSIRNQIHLGDAIMEVHLSGPGWVEGEWLGRVTCEHFR